MLLRALADRNQPVQVEALELLVRRGGEQAVTILAAMLGTGGLAPLPRDSRAGALSGASAAARSCVDLCPSAARTSSCRSSRR